MTTHYKIRKARLSDRDQIRMLIRESVAKEKSLINPDMITSAFIEEFVDKVITKGNMLVVENDRLELELIGEVHYYNMGSGKDEDQFQEFSFISRMVFDQHEREKELVNWLFNEVECRHRKVFRVELMSPVCQSSSVELYQKMGLTMEGNVYKRIKNTTGHFQTMLPLSWINPSFN
jgi:hypothetical protein